MYIKDLQTGKVRKYGTDRHDSLVISENGRTLEYHNLQNGGGSRYGEYRFCDEEGKIPAETECNYGEEYFNIGGWESTIERDMDRAIDLLEQEPCEDAISREQLVRELNAQVAVDAITKEVAIDMLEHLPPVTSQSKTGHCKDCKYFEYDSVAKVDGIPLIVAHEICKKWGNGCKTREDGYCFLFEPQKSEGQK